MELFKPTISNAIEITNGVQWQAASAFSWNQLDSKTIYYTWNVSGYKPDTTTYVQNIGVNVSISGGYDLEYYISYGTSSSTSIETDWYNVKDTIDVAFKWSSSVTSSLRVNVYVRRVDGVDLSVSDPSTSRIFANGIRVSNQDVEQTTAIPSDWLGTSTVSGVNPLQTMTTIASTYYINETVVSDSLDIPPVTESAIGQLMSIVSRILALPYLKFMVFFAVIMGLVSWFLH